jgi:hypothetical protein
MLAHRNLNPACLPIPPHPQILSKPLQAADDPHPSRVSKGLYHLKLSLSSLFSKRLVAIKHDENPFGRPFGLAASSAGRSVGVDLSE